MTLSPWLQGLSSIGLLLVAMALVAVVEAVIPLGARGRWHKAHLGPNLALTFITFATNLVMNVALVTALAWAEARSFGLLYAIALPSFLASIVAVVALDFSFYAAHVGMHKVRWLWRFHQVHHSDPALDVTTTIRQHPGESVYRYMALAVFALALGASPAAFAIYRIASAVNGLLEHANLRVPRWLDDVLSLMTTWPSFHKVHHSRHPAQTDTNYGNLFSWWDRIFSTFTPAREGRDVDHGLDGYDDPAAQTTAGLLAAPFRRAKDHQSYPLAAAKRARVSADQVVLGS